MLAQYATLLTDSPPIMQHEQVPHHSEKPAQARREGLQDSIWILVQLHHLRQLLC